MVYYLHNRKTRLQTVVTYHATVYFEELKNICIRRKEKSMKRVKTILAILSMSFLLSPISATCASTSDSATISQKKVSITVGESKKIKVINYKSKIKWSCDKKSIVSIKKMNRCTVKISGKKKGTAKVLAKLANGKTLKCNVMVSEPFYTHEISTSEERSDEVTFSGKKFTNFTKKDTICNYDRIKSIPEDTTTVIRNMTELKEYMDTTTKDSSDDSLHKKVFNKYTNSFFKNHVLALVSYDASMSNNDYCFKGMTVTDNTLYINYNQTSFSYGGPLPLHSKIPGCLEGACQTRWNLNRTLQPKTIVFPVL